MQTAKISESIIILIGNSRKNRTRQTWVCPSRATSSWASPNACPQSTRLCRQSNLNYTEFILWLIEAMPMICQTTSINLTIQQNESNTRSISNSILVTSLSQIGQQSADYITPNCIASQLCDWQQVTFKPCFMVCIENQCQVHQITIKSKSASFYPNYQTFYAASGHFYRK